MPLINETEAVCWANVAESTRTRGAWVWKDGRRVEHRDPKTGRQYIERIPQGAQYGTPITGLRPANLRTFVKIMRYEGDEANIRIAQGAGHDISADNSYERYMLDRKGVGEGWIPAGSCPVLMAMNGDLMPHKIVSELVLADFAKHEACAHRDLGIRNPPCRHYEAEREARLAKRQERHDQMLEAHKSEEAKLLEGQVKVQKDTAAALTTSVQTLVGAVKELREERETAPPTPPAAKGR